MIHRTIEEAQAALDIAEHDVVNDMGPDAWSEGFADMVRVIAAESTGPVAAELCRRQGVRWPL